MKKLRYFIAFVCCAFSAQGADLSSHIQSLIGEVDPTLNIGIDIRSLEDGRIIFQKNAQRSYIPASTQKILTVAAAMANPPTPFETKIFYDASENVSYLVFGGDPLFNFKDLKALISQAKNKKMIGKEVRVVMSKGGLPPVPPGATYEATNYCHGAGFVSEMINRNSVVFDLEGEGNTKAKVSLASGQSSFAIKNSTYIREKCFEDPEVGEWDQVQRTSLDFHGGVVFVNGCVPEEFKVKMCLPVKEEDHQQYIQGMVKEALGSSSVKVVHSLPKGKLKVVSYKTGDFEKLARIALKDSDNLVTHSLFAAITRKDEWPRNWHFASKVLQGILEAEFSMTFTDQDVLGDGAGLSMHNRLTPQTLTVLLGKIHNRFGEGYKKLLAEGGVDGTLQNRFKECGMKVYAKTGSLAGITTLAGYLESGGKSYALTIFVNGTPGQSKEYRKLVDRIVGAIGRN